MGFPNSWNTCMKPHTEGHMITGYWNEGMDRRSQFPV